MFILRGLQSASELYRLSDRHLSTKFSANFCGYRGEVDVYCFLKLNFMCFVWYLSRIRPYFHFLLRNDMIKSGCSILDTLYLEINPIAHGKKSDRNRDSLYDPTCWILSFRRWRECAEPSPVIAEGDMNVFHTTDRVNRNHYQHSAQKTA
jgi:hypothetical protein